jgi:hypothetical protein
MLEPDFPDVRRDRLWVRVVAALVALSLLAFTGIYAANFFFTDDTPRLDTDVSDASDPADVPARPLACGTTESVSPVDTSLGSQRRLEEIEQRVEQLRALEFDRHLATEFLSPEAIEEEVKDLTYEDYSETEIDRDERILQTLGLIPNDLGLPEVLDSLATQVAGFYDPSSDRMVVSSSGNELDPAGELTLAHELEHALAHQVLSWPLSDDPPGSELDSQLAARSLVEGDATLLQQHYAATVMTPEQAAEIINDPATQEALDSLGDVPYPIQVIFDFPYLQGYAFVCDLYREGGWGAVDGAYARPPTTTAQILFPQRYRTDEGAREPLPLGAPNGDWKRIESSALGAADLLVLFQAPGGDPGRALEDPLGRASAWAGGTMKVFSDGEDTALGMTLVERDPGDGLCASMTEWYRAAFPRGEPAPRQPGETLAVSAPTSSAVITCSERSVRFGMAPDLETARSLVR